MDSRITIPALIYICKQEEFINLKFTWWCCTTEWFECRNWKYLYYSNNRLKCLLKFSLQYMWIAVQYGWEISLMRNVNCSEWAQLTHSWSWQVSMGKPIDSVVHGRSLICSWWWQLNVLRFLIYYPFEF